DDDEEAASGIALPDDEVTRKVPVVAKPVDEGDESVLWKIVEQRNLLRGDLRRRSACGRRDVAECAIQVVVLGGDAGRLGGRASAEVELQLATGGLVRRRRGERGHGGAEGRRFDRSAVIQLERLVLPAGGEVDPGRHDQVSRGARRIAEFDGTLSAAGGSRVV